MNQTRPVLTEEMIRARNVFRIAASMFVFAIAIQFFAVIVMVMNNDLQNQLRHGDIFLWFGYSVVLAISLWVNRNGRSIWAVWLILAGLFVIIPVSSLRTNGLGLPEGGFLILIAAFIVAQTRLPSRTALLLVTASLLVGVASMLLDFYGPAGRPGISSTFATLIPAVLTLEVLALGFLFLQRFRDYSIRTKFIIALVAVAIVSGPAVGIVSGLTFANNLTQSVGANLDTLAQNKALIVGNLLDQELSSLETFSSGRSVQDNLLATNAFYTGDHAAIDSELVQAELRWRTVDKNDPLVQRVLSGSGALDLLQFQKQFPENTQLFLTDKYGATVAATAHLPNYYYGAELWWQQVYNNGSGGLYLSQPQNDPTLKTAIITIGVPIRDQDSGVLIGVLAATYRLTALTAVLSPASFGKTGGADILTPSGSILRNEGDLQTLDAQSLAGVRTSANAIFAPITYEGTASLVSQAPITSNDSMLAGYLKDLGWTLIVDQAQAEALSAVNGATQIALVTGGAALLLAGLLALGVAQFLSAPLRRLTDVAARAAEGDLTVQAPVEGGDEIGVLSTTFNRMTTQLRQTLEGLEQRVAERTQQLSEASETLRQQNGYLTALNDTTIALMSHLDLQALLQTLVTRAGALVNTEHGYVFLHEPGASEIEMRVGTGAYNEFIGSRARLGVGLAGIVWQTGAELVVDNYQTWGHRLQDPRRDILHAVVGVPIRSGGQTIGVIGLAYLEEGRVFGKAEVETLNRFAQLASIAIDNARSFQQQTALAAENRRLFEQAQRANEELNALTRRLTGEGWEKYLSALSGELLVTDAAPQLDIGAPDLTVLDHAAASGDIITAANGHSSIALPLVLRDQVIGALEVEDLQPTRQWNEEDIDLMKQVAEHVALALDNARLLEQVQAGLIAARQRAEREAQLASINDRLHATTDVNVILQTAAEALRRTTGSAFAVVRLSRKEDGDSR